jgi:hypothetical protein
MWNFAGSELSGGIITYFAYEVTFASLKILVFLTLRVTSVFEKFIFYGGGLVQRNTNKTRSPSQMDDGSLHIHRSFTEMNSSFCTRHHPWYFI